MLLLFAREQEKLNDVCGWATHTSTHQRKECPSRAQGMMKAAVNESSICYTTAKCPDTPCLCRDVRLDRPSGLPVPCPNETVPLFILSDFRHFPVLPLPCVCSTLVPGFASVEVRNVPDPAGDPDPLVVAGPLRGQAHLRVGPDLRTVVVVACRSRRPLWTFGLALPNLRTAAGHNSRRHLRGRFC